MWSGAQVSPPAPAAPPAGPPPGPGIGVLRPEIAKAIQDIDSASSAQDIQKAVDDVKSAFGSDSKTLRWALSEIESKITKPQNRAVFQRVLAGRGPGPGRTSPRPPGAQGPQQKGGLSPDQRKQVYDVVEQQRNLGPAMQATRSDGENWGGKRADATHQAQAAEGESRAARGYFEQAAQGLRTLRQQVADGWNQLKLIGEQIAKKADNTRWTMGMAFREAQRWYMNYLWISLSNLRSNEGKIQLRWLAISQAIAWSGINSKGVAASPLEVGALEAVTQPPTESFHAALKAGKDIEAERAKYDGDAKQLAMKERDTIPEREEEQARYERQEREHKERGAFQRRLSLEARQALAVNKQRAASEREKYDALEKRKNEILQAAGVDPQVS